MIQECPWKFEFVRQMFRQRLNSKRFCRVVAAVEHVDAQFFSQRKGPVWSLACNECIHAFHCRLLQVTPCPASDHADLAADFGSAGKQPRLGASRYAQCARKVRSRNPGARLEAEMLIVIHEKGFQIFQTERNAKQCVVSQPRMSIQRQMRAVHRDIIFQ